MISFFANIYGNERRVVWLTAGSMAALLTGLFVVGLRMCHGSARIGIARASRRPPLSPRRATPAGRSLQRDASKKTLAKTHRVRLVESGIPQAQKRQ